ncbi:hypothetical protein VNO78_16579 [Psophocarpus tetragonolobus]|uniref:Pentatricopeptide repeat-containing protein n=1 Tax=Psophocarpus tetragonolobus TaxID=3891 RepID=A0AAN9SLM9_PSOTE
MNLSVEGSVSFDEDGILDGHVQYHQPPHKHILEDLDAATLCSSAVCKTGRETLEEHGGIHVFVLDQGGVRLSRSSCINQKNLPAVHLIWQEYTKNYSMSIIALRKFIWSFTRLQDFKSAYETLQQIVSLATRGDIVDGKFYSTRLDIPVPSNKGTDSTILDMKENQKLDSCIIHPLMYLPDSISASIEQQIIHLGDKKDKSAELYGHGKKHSLLKKVLRWSFDLHGCEKPKEKKRLLMNVLRRSFDLVIHGCAKPWKKKSMLARELIAQMENLGLHPSNHTNNGFIKAVASRRNFGDAIELLKQMQKKNLKPYDSTLATLSIICSRARQLDLAESLLCQISVGLYPNAYNSLLGSCHRLDAVQ